MDKQELTKLIELNYSYRKLAAHFSVCETTIAYWLKKYGLKTTRVKESQLYVDGQCKHCGAIGENNFYKSDRGSPRRICKNCYRELYSVLRLQRLDNLKKQCVDYKGGKCEKCGYNKCLACLDFHHKNPNEKDPKWTKMRQRNFDDVMMRELDKCALLCRNCHGETHWETGRKIREDRTNARKDKKIHSPKPKINTLCSVCGRFFQTKWAKQIYCSSTCSSLNQRRAERPNKDALVELLKNESWVAIGRKFGVSDNTVRKWAERYKII